MPAIIKHGKRLFQRSDPGSLVSRVPGQADDSMARRLWLISPAADFWLASGGASAGLLAFVAMIFLRGDRELDALDLVLSEFHLGATYYVVLRRQLWRSRRVDVLTIPLLILALTYALSIAGETLLLTSIAMYAAVWHRGRQSFGVARSYQRQVGGPVSQTHELLFRGAIYLPMLAGTLAYTYLSPAEYGDEPYLAATAGQEMTWLIGAASIVWVVAYLAWTVAHRSDGTMSVPAVQALRFHPAERWVVLAHAVAFGSGYVLGAQNASFLLVLAVHHEVQYLYFVYATVCRPGDRQPISDPQTDAPPAASGLNASHDRRSGFRAEIKQMARFLVWPVLGFVGAIVGGWLGSAWLAPLGLGGLFCHYWLDGRIWTRRSLRG